MDPHTGKHGSLQIRCITVDNEQIFVSSANFTEGQDRNIEVGLLVWGHPLLLNVSVGSLRRL
jgi:hypothetical protein